MIEITYLLMSFHCSRIIPPRAHNLILQSFEIVCPENNNIYLRRSKHNRYFHHDGNKKNPDFICTVSFIHTNKIGVEIMRMDRPQGWTQDLFLLLENCERIHIGPSTENKLFLERETVRMVSPRLDSPWSHIPKIIVQTGRELEEKNVLLQNSVSSFLNWNPGSTHLFYNDQDAIFFMKQYFPQYLQDYLYLRPGAFKADLFRYCFLYQFGGCYFDYKLLCRGNLDDLVKPDDKLILCSDYNDNNDIHFQKGIYNAIMFSEKNNPLIGEAIKLSISNIRNRLYPSGDPLAITGPTVLQQAWQLMGSVGSHIRLKHQAFGNFNNYQNMIIVDKKNENVLFQKSSFLNHSNNYYHDCFHHHRVYHENVYFLSPCLYIIPENDAYGNPRLEEKENKIVFTGMMGKINVKIINTHSLKITNHTIHPFSPYIDYVMPCKDHTLEKSKILSNLCAQELPKNLPRAVPSNVETMNFRDRKVLYKSKTCLLNPFLPWETDLLHHLSPVSYS